MTSETSAAPNPGSQAAIDEGCTCAVMDNHYGRGVPTKSGSNIFWISGDCPVHAKQRSGTDDK